MTGKALIQQLQLTPHPEGGYYRETYRSAQTMHTGDSATRNVCTAIYFLLQEQDRSHFHRIKSDELWYFHQGETLEILVIAEGNLQRILLGNDITAGETPQAMIPANSWFASHVKGETGFALVSCSVAPGFDFADFEMAKTHELATLFPEHTSIIDQFSLV